MKGEVGLSSFPLRDDDDDDDDEFSRHSLTSMLLSQTAFIFIINAYYLL